MGTPESMRVCEMTLPVQSESGGGPSTIGTRTARRSPLWNDRGRDQATANSRTRSTMKVRFLPVLILLVACGGDQSGRTNEAEREAARNAFMLGLLGDAKGVTVGQEDAPVVVHAFVDFQCPGCRAAALRFLDSFKARYVESGQVRFVHLDLPIERIHPNAFAAAIAGRCAERLGAFEPYHDALYETQAEWAGMPDSDLPRYLLGLARGAELDAERFQQCMREAPDRETIRANMRLAESIGVRATPTFFVNGRRVVGAGREITAAVNAALAEAGER